jgi:rhomboid protease GluP
VVLLVLLVLAVAVVVHRATTDAERAAFARQVQLRIDRWVAQAAKRYRAHEPFFEWLRARKPHAPVTCILAIVNTVMFVVVIVASLVGGQDALVEWGASVGPRTTNGEWWRLTTYLAVHAGLLQLLASLVGFVPLGLILERLIGSAALAAVYITSGVFAGLMTVSAYPMAASAGASGAICGVYGLAFATLTWGVLQQPRVTVPWEVLKWLAWAALIFLGYNIPTGIVPLGAELVGFIVGALCGAVLARRVATRPVPARRSAAVAAAAFAMAVSVAVPLRGIRDVRPDIDRMRETDDRTAATFRTAITQLVLGRATEKAMTELIEREIIPALEAEQRRLASTGLVPDDQKPFMTAAADYLQLRIESWRLRTTAYRKHSLSMLRQADTKEGAARDLLVRLPYPLSPG